MGTATNSKVADDKTERRRRDTDLPCTNCPADSVVVNGVGSCCSSGYYPETNDLGQCDCSSIPFGPTGTTTVRYSEIGRRHALLSCTTGFSCPARSRTVNGVASCCSTGYYEDKNDYGQCVCSSVQPATSTITTPVLVVDDSPCLTGASCPDGSPLDNGVISCCTSETYIEINDIGQCGSSIFTIEIEE
eukprot:Awhi_evm1s5994